MPVPDINAILGIAAGLLLLVVPARMSRLIEDEREARLAELEAGARESYFEEKRSLRAYPSPAVQIVRVAGLTLLSLGVARLWIQYAG